MRYVRGFPLRGDLFALYEISGGPALALARDCPMLVHGGSVEIAELSLTDESFDQWLDKDPSRGGRRDGRG
jgi:hypothetical protein